MLPHLALACLLPLAASAPTSQPDAEILYERAPTPEELARHRIEGVAWSAGAEAIATWRERARTGDLDAKTLRLEIQTRTKPDGSAETYVYRRYLTGDKLWEAEWERFRRHAEETLPLRRDVRGWLRVEGNAGMQDLGNIYYDDIEYIGDYYERYRTGSEPRFRYAGATIREVPGGHRLDEHEFLRREIKCARLAAARTGFGTVVTGIDERFNRMTAWVSGENIAVYVSADPRASTSDLIAAYGEKYPSRLPKDLQIDKTAWGREDVGRWIRRAHMVLDKGDDYLPHGGHNFMFVMYSLRASVYMPGHLDRLQALAPGSGRGRRHDDLRRRVEERQAVLRYVEEWWAANKDRTYWDEKFNRLVVEGQTPDDIARQEREEEQRRKAAELEAALNKPFTAEDRERAMAVFRKALQDRLKRELEQHLKEAPAERRDQVKLEQTGPNTWRRTRIGGLSGTLYTDQAQGPFFADYPSRKYPLKGWIKWKFGSDATPQTHTWYFDKLTGKWTKPRKEWLVPDLPATQPADP